MILSIYFIINCAALRPWTGFLDKVGMAGPKSAQTRFVGIIIFTIGVFPYEYMYYIKFIPSKARQTKFTVYCHRLFDFACRRAVIQISN